jgi:hypothetical protein
MDMSASPRSVAVSRAALARPGNRNLDEVTGIGDAAASARYSLADIGEIGSCNPQNQRRFVVTPRCGEVK